MGKFAGLNGYTELFVRELLYFSTVGANQMMMGIIPERLFVLGKLTSKLMLDNQFTFQ